MSKRILPCQMPDIVPDALAVATKVATNSKTPALTKVFTLRVYLSRGWRDSPLNQSKWNLTCEDDGSRILLGHRILLDHREALAILRKREDLRVAHLFAVLYALNGDRATRLGPRAAFVLRRFASRLRHTGHRDHKRMIGLQCEVDNHRFGHLDTLHGLLFLSCRHIRWHTRHVDLDMTVPRSRELTGECCAS